MTANNALRRNYWGDDRDGDPCRPAVPESEPCGACLGDGLDLTDDNGVAWCKVCGGLGYIPSEMSEELVRIMDEELASDPYRPESPPLTEAEIDKMAELLHTADDEQSQVY